MTNKVVIITGGANGIGKALSRSFAEKGDHVCIFDKALNDYFIGDLSKQKDMDDFVDKVISDYGKVDVLINNAAPLMRGLDECSYEQFNQALLVGVTAPFYLTKRFLPYFTEHAVIINLSSTRENMSQPNTESYSAAKGGIGALTHAMAISLAGRVRVNSVAPGWINTSDEPYTKADHMQHPVKRIGTPADIVNVIHFLCAEQAGFITGQTITVDGGMSKQMIYSGDNGWRFTE